MERTLSWLMRSRRLVRDVETLPAMHEAMVLWSMSMLMSRRLAGRRWTHRTAWSFIITQEAQSGALVDHLDHERHG
ncbi:hypothetical protein GCM10010307_75300 [Streptomyces vastus]|uniref:Transposase n=1 Tax=Streptomyces vastus TaxID=285451 RepID=A0ABN3RRQ4_9ACTN